MRRATLFGFLTAAVLGLALGAGAAMVMRGDVAQDLSQTVRSTGRALVGGPFTLTDHTGKRVTEKDFAGRMMLVYFGYTYCPDICPGELQIMAAAIDSLGDKAKKVTPVFITVDPKRDTVEQMASYVPNFHTRMVGLTGTKEEIVNVAKAYRVYFARVKSENGEVDDDTYLMDHSSIIYLMDAKGEFLRHFPHGTNAEAMAKGINKHL